MNIRSQYNRISIPFTIPTFATAIAVSLISGTLVHANQTNESSQRVHTNELTIESNELDAQEKAEKAIISAIEEYARARYAGDVKTVRSRLHPALASRTVADTYWGQPSDEWVRPLTFEGTSFLNTSANRVLLDNPVSGRVEITVHDIEQRTAAATLISEDRIEMLHMIHFQDQWVVADIVTNFLDEPGDRPTAQTARHNETITKILTDYCVGFYEVDGQKVQDTCHPMLSKRVVEHNEEADQDYLRQITYEEIVILGETFNKSFDFKPDARCIVDVYEVRGDIAIAKMTGTIWFDYFQLLNVEGEWQIVNIMFEGLPRSRWAEA